MNFGDSDCAKVKTISLNITGNVSASSVSVCWGLVNFIGVFAQSGFEKYVHF
jgi:hypothetical protein